MRDKVAWGGVERRRRAFVNRLQARVVVIQFCWIAAILAAFAGLLFGPVVLDLYGESSPQQRLAAELFLDLHTRLWPALVALAVSLAATIALQSHRVVGPLVRFTAVFEAVARGELWVPSKIRASDYLQRESLALDAMLASLRHRIGESMAATKALDAAILRLPPDQSEEARHTLARLRTSLAAFELERPPKGNCVSAPSAPDAAERSVRATAGFTLVEVLLVTTVIGLLAAIAVPGYEAALEKARVTRAIGDIRVVQSELQTYALTNGCYPGTLAAIDRGSMRDPWGSLYAYGVLDATPGGGGGKGGKGGGGSGTCLACSGSCLTRGQARKDRNLVPVNSDFDFYSLGKDRQSIGPVTAGPSLDDVVRASDGGFIGLGRDF